MAEWYLSSITVITRKRHLQRGQYFDALALTI